MEEKSVQAVFSHWWGKISKPSRIALCSTFIIGMLCNLFIFTNKTVNHDDILAELHFNFGLDVASGRYMWLLIRRLTTYYTMPVLYGIIGMAFLAVSAAMLVNLLKIKDTIFVVLVSGILGTFPINACYYSYFSISPIYYFAIVTAVTGMFLVGKFGAKPWQRIAGIVVGGFFIMMSLGTYQSFLAYAIGIVFCMAFVDMFSNEWKFKDWFKKYFEYAMTAGAGYVLYFITTKIVLKITGESLRPYAGTDQMFNIGPIAAIQSVVNTYIMQNQFYFTTQAMNSKGFILVNKMILGIFLFMIVVALVQLIKKRNWLQAIVLVLMTIFAPVFLNFVYVMINGKSVAHMLMKYSLLLPYVLLIEMVACSDFKLQIKKVNFKIILQWLACACTVVIIYFCAITTNKLYLRMYYNTQAIDSLCTEIIARLSMEEDFLVDQPVYFANFSTFFDEKYETSAEFDEETQAFDWMWMGTDVYPSWFSYSHLVKYMDFNHHIRLIPSNNKEKEGKVLESEEFAEMNVFPEGNSVRRINGLLTIKFGE